MALCRDAKNSHLKVDDWGAYNMDEKIADRLKSTIENQPEIRMGFRKRIGKMPPSYANGNCLLSRGVATSRSLTLPVPPMKASKQI